MQAQQTTEKPSRTTRQGAQNTISATQRPSKSYQALNISQVIMALQEYSAVSL